MRSGLLLIVDLERSNLAIDAYSDRRTITIRAGIPAATKCDGIGQRMRGSLCVVDRWSRWDALVFAARRSAVPITNDHDR